MESDQRSLPELQAAEVTEGWLDSEKDHHTLVVWQGWVTRSGLPCSQMGGVRGRAKLTWQICMQPC